MITLFPRSVPRVELTNRRKRHYFGHYYLRPAKFAPFAIVALFVAFNFTGLNSAMAPVVSAASVETIPADMPSSGDCDLDWIIFRAGEKSGVDPRFIHAVIQQESQYNAKAVSPVGAQGLMQMMPATAERFGLQDPFDPAANVEAGTKYLKWLLDRFNGDVSLALAGYNAGEGSVDKYQGVPPYSETQNYVKKIVSNYGKTYHPVLTPDDAKLAFHLTNEIPAASSGL
ncbi:MAG TPA: lytic transglycosylase domain-containing protein [Pyrinomonadaceae bacterium]|nr:lytic transglycosylase domain-containing protein [Pyrinomonadaceae bacterium]